MTVNEILSALPPSAANTRALIQQIAQVADSLDSWQAVLDNITPERVARWARELAAGRPDDDLRDDILDVMVGTERLMELGINETTANQIILGGNEGGQNLGPVLKLPKVQERLSRGAVDADDPVTNTPPSNVNGTTIPTGGKLIKVNNPAGSDAPALYYLVYNWRGVQLAYEVGDIERLNELFGSIDVFDDMATVNQTRFDSLDYVEVGTVDELVGSTESIGSQIERDVRELGFEDLPGWLANSPQALALIAQGTNEEWSSGRLWQELSKTATFKQRWGAVLPHYQAQGVTIAQAVAQIERDEEAMRAAMRPFFPEGAGAPTLARIHQMLNAGWTSGAAAQVLEAAEILRRDPDSLARSNFILKQAGIQQTLSEASFINALMGHGPQEVIETLNTANAARALAEAGIDLSNEDAKVIMDLVDTSDRLQTADAWRSLGQELSLNLIRFNRELDQEKLGVLREDMIAAAFGQESPSGKSSGEVMGLLARFERDRRAASQGYEGMTGFLNQEGRLQIQGVGGL